MRLNPPLIKIKKFNNIQQHKDMIIIVKSNLGLACIY